MAAVSRKKFLSSRWKHLSAVNFAWDFTDGIVTETTDATIKHTFKDPAFYNPRLILSDQAGCKGTAFLKDPPS